MVLMSLFININVTCKKINKDTQEMPLWRKAFPRHEKKERWGTNNAKTNATWGFAKEGGGGGGGGGGRVFNDNSGIIFHQFSIKTNIYCGYS